MIEILQLLLYGTLLGSIIALGAVGVTLTFGSDFQLGGIALGTLLVIVYFHLVNGRRGSDTGHVTQALSHEE